MPQSKDGPELLDDPDVDAVSGGISIETSRSEYATSTRRYQASDPASLIDGYCIVTDISTSCPSTPSMDPSKAKSDPARTDSKAKP
ncbi:MAG: hypothetical protein AAF479_09215 [Pseudomonadota bacterium]